MGLGKSSAAGPTYQSPNNPTQPGWQSSGSSPFDIEGDYKNYMNKMGAYNAQYGSPYQNAATDQSQQSHVGLNGAFGSSGWQQDPKTGAWTQSQQFNGPLGNAASGLENQVQNMGAIGSGAGADAAYAQAKSRLDPSWGQQGEMLQSHLASQGLDPGTDAANNAQGNFDRAKNDAYSSAQNNSWQQGLAGQMLPYQQLQALQGLLGNAQGVGGAQSPELLAALGMQGNFNLGQANQNNQLVGQGYQGAGAAAGAAAYALSDLRAKTHVRELAAEALPGVPWVEFEYRHAMGVRHVGVLAQQVLAVRPDLVRERADGLLEVNYGGLS